MTCPLGTLSNAHQPVKARCRWRVSTPPDSRASTNRSDGSGCGGMIGLARHNHHRYFTPIHDLSQLICTPHRADRQPPSSKHKAKQITFRSTPSYLLTTANQFLSKAKRGRIAVCDSHLGRQTKNATASQLATVETGRCFLIKYTLY